MAVSTAIHSSFLQPYQQCIKNNRKIILVAHFLVLLGFISLQHGILEVFQSVKKHDLSLYKSLREAKSHRYGQVLGT